MAEFNLDQYREEHALEPHKLTVCGKVYALPAKMPLMLAELIQEQQFYEACELLFGEDAETVAPTFSLDKEGGDLIVLLEALWGDDVPQSSASSGSSPNIGARSRQTSKGSTGAT